MSEIKKLKKLVLQIQKTDSNGSHDTQIDDKAKNQVSNDVKMLRAQIFEMHQTMKTFDQDLTHMKAAANSSK